MIIEYNVKVFNILINMSIYPWYTAYKYRWHPSSQKVWCESMQLVQKLALFASCLLCCCIQSEEKRFRLIWDDIFQPICFLKSIEESGMNLGLAKYVAFLLICVLFHVSMVLQCVNCKTCTEFISLLNYATLYNTVIFLSLCSN